MPNELQVRFPLSPRKFWKKMIEKIVFGILLFSILTVLIFVLMFFLFPSLPSSLFAAVLYPAAVSLFAVTVIIVGYVAYVRAYIRLYYYDATDNYITIRKGVFTPAEIHVLYAKIQDVYVDRDILDRLLGLYDVHLASATIASSIEAHIDGVDEATALGLKNILLQKIQDKDSGTPTASNLAPITPMSQPSTSVAFASEISNRTYPITGAWIVQQVIVSFYSAVFAAFLFFIVLIASKNGNSSIAQIFGLGAGFLMTASIVVFVVFCALRITFSILWRENYSFVFLSDYIVTRQGIIAKTEDHLPYRAIQDVSISQSIVERMLGLATVRIENAVATSMSRRRAVIIPGQSLQKANEISDAIKSIALTKDSSQTGL